jgi:DUF1680 family protein
MRGGEGLARAIEFSHLLEQDTLYLPYYGSALAAVPFADGELWLEQRSGYPHSDRVQIEVVRDAPPTPKALCLYIPSWALPEQVLMYLNGTRLVVGATGAFVPIERLWQAGDRITLELAYGARREPTINQYSLTGQHAYWYGPLLLGISHQDEPLVLSPDVPMQPLGIGRFQVAGTEYILAPTDDLCTLPTSAALRDRRQVLFADGSECG